MYRTKTKQHLKKHKPNVHSIDIVWCDCPELGCEYRTKEKSSIERHRASRHRAEVHAKVPMGQVVIEVEGEEGGSGGEGGGGCGERGQRRDMEDVRGWWVGVQDEV